jgi:hypothetical protein
MIDLRPVGYIIGMLVAGGMVQALVVEPLVQFGQIIKLPPHGKEPLADKTDLILYLPLLPTGCRSAGHRLKQIERSQT